MIHDQFARGGTRMRPGIITFLGLLLPTILGVPARSGYAGGPRRPHVVVIVAAGLGYAELGCQGAADVRTPHIDSITRHGVRFTSADVTAPVCTPSRAGLLTGRYQQRFGHEHNAIGMQNGLPHVGPPTSERTIADDLRAAGRATRVVGEWHLGGTEPYRPQRRGSGDFFGFLHEGHFFVDGRHSQGRLAAPAQ
jgi:arylsulfatase A-like enzyme